MAPPPSSAVSPVVALFVRIFTFICLLISIIILTTNTFTINVQGIEVKSKFNNYYVYRYMLAVGVIGMAYTLLQTALTVYFVATGNRLGSNSLILVDFYADKIVSYMLATGAAAGFGFNVDVKRAAADSDTERFLNKANAAASLLFVGFLLAAVSSVFSSLSLPKRL